MPRHTSQKRKASSYNTAYLMKGKFAIESSSATTTSTAHELVAESSASNLLLREDSVQETSGIESGSLLASDDRIQLAPEHASALQSVGSDLTNLFFRSTTLKDGDESDGSIPTRSNDEMMEGTDGSQQTSSLSENDSDIVTQSPGKVNETNQVFFQDFPDEDDNENDVDDYLDYEYLEDEELSNTYDDCHDYEVLNETEEENDVGGRIGDMENCGARLILIDEELYLDLIKSIHHIEGANCEIKDIDVAKKKRNGLQQLRQFKCNKCGKASQLKRVNPGNLNEKAVVKSFAKGTAYEDLRAFGDIMNLEVMSPRAYGILNHKVGKATIEMAKKAWKRQLKKRNSSQDF